MSELQIIDRVRSAFRARNDMIEGRPLFLPDPCVRGFKPVAHHGFTAQSA